MPHAFPAHVVAMGSAVHPHLPTSPPPPQVSGAAHVPQMTSLPQESFAVPHVLPASSNDRLGVQPH
ncbi:MAG: hypothetical protein U0235_33355 [Polyangiaceae bacterium]